MTFGKEGMHGMAIGLCRVTEIELLGAEQSRVHCLETASAILDVFQKHGRNEIDTACAYSKGLSEIMLGDLN